MENLAWIGGAAAVLGLVGYDLLRSTIASEGCGPLSRAAAWSSFRLWGGVAAIGDRGVAQSMAGPGALVAIAAVWVVGGWLGFFLLFMTEGALEHADTGAPPTPMDVVAYAGSALSTLGASRMRTGSGLWDALAGVAAIYGMVTLTLSVSFLLSLLQTARRARTLALEIDAALGPGGDVGRALSPDRAAELMGVALALRSAPIAGYYDTRWMALSFPVSLARLVTALECAEREGHRPPSAMFDAAFAALPQDGAAAAGDAGPRERARRWAAAHTLHAPSQR